jgi:hypothetical protein
VILGCQRRWYCTLGTTVTLLTEHTYLLPCKDIAAQKGMFSMQHGAEVALAILTLRQCGSDATVDGPYFNP